MTYVGVSDLKVPLKIRIGFMLTDCEIIVLRCKIILTNMNKKVYSRTDKLKTQ